MTGMMLTGAAAPSPLFRTFMWVALALLSLSVLGLSENATRDLIGRGIFYSVALSFIPVAGYLALVSLQVPPALGRIVAVFLVFLLANLVYALAGMNGVAFTFLVQYLVIVCAFVLFMQAGLSGENTGFRMVALMCVGILALYAVQAVLDPGLSVGEGWAGGLSNQNLFGMFVFMLLCVATVLMSLGRRPPRGLVIGLVVMSFVLIYASKSRSSLIALAIFYATYFAWPFLTRRKGAPLVYFAAVLGVIWYMIYSGANRIALAGVFDRLLNDLSQGYGKNVDSGRSIIWNYALDVIGDKPVLGWGTGLTTTSILNTGLSFHNWYLTVLYHFGLLGLTAYLGILFLIWNAFCRFGHNTYAKLAGCALIGMMMTQVYEVSLTQNNLNIGLVYWCLFGLVAGRITRDQAAAPVVAAPRRHALSDGLTRPA